MVQSHCLKRLAYHHIQKGCIKIKVIEANFDAKGRKIAIVVSRFNHFIVDSLLEGAIDTLKRHGNVADDDITVIGTFNLDPRSANLNTESITIIPSKKVSLSVKAGMLEEMQPENAWQTTLEWNPDGEESMLKQLGVKLRRVVPKNIL